MNDPARRFDGRAADYDRYRPRYPRALAETILDGLWQPVVADVGAGTGIASELLRDAGANVIAIEPNAAMREVLQRKPGIEVRDGRGEATGLPDASVDVVTVVQAFHWCEGAAALAEFARILRPHGRLAAVFMDRDHDHAPSAAYAALERRHGGAAMLAARPASAGSSATIAQSKAFKDARTLHFPIEQRLDREGLQGRVRGLSHVPLDGPERDAALADADALFARYARDGAIELRNVALLVLAVRS